MDAGLRHLRAAKGRMVIDNRQRKRRQVDVSRRFDAVSRMVSDVAASAASTFDAARRRIARRHPIEKN